MCGSNNYLQDGGRKNIRKKEKTVRCLYGFEKKKEAYDRVDWLALWEVLRIYGVGGKLLSAGVRLSINTAM